ncbi:MAG: CoA-binding protein [Dehalococcoidia bacterium]|nr:CoA-binding protein [Dehalococcoidia bacterium]
MQFMEGNSLLLNDGFSKAFHPASIAVVGVSDTKTRRMRGPYGGFTTLCNLLDLGFEGRIYPINPKASEILGLKAYPSVSALPEPIDLVIVSVPARLVPGVLEDCIQAGALNVHVMSSGFGETAQEEGLKLHEEVRRIALSGGIRLIGPNCMGLQVPSAKMSTFEVRPQNNGPVSVVSQSGSVVSVMMTFAPASGIGFSKAISCGNSLVLDITDYVEFLADDPDTGIIGLYIEGIKDGRHLLEIVRKTNPVKPVIIWKVGLSDSSARAALSHSGMLGGERRSWDSFFKQTGAVRVKTVEELSDSIMTFLYMKPVRGKNAAVLTAGGGVTVAAGEICTEGGINPPALAPETREKLLKIISLVNQGVANPLDVPDSLARPDMIKQILLVLSEDPGIDFLILDCLSLVFKYQIMADMFAQAISEFVQENRSNKPLAVAINTLWGDLPESQKGPWTQKLLKLGVPVYGSLARACRAISGFADYHRRFSVG